MNAEKQDEMKILVDTLVKEVIDSLREQVMASIRAKLTEVLMKSLSDSEFNKHLNDQMRSGIYDIYKEISSARKSTGEIVDPSNAEQLFSEASDQLDEILKTTENATTQIMDIVESQQEVQAESNNILHNLKSGDVTEEQLEQLQEMSDALQNDLIEIMTALSFQDLTGQRIKIIINALKKVEKIVFDLYLSTQMKIKVRDKSPEKNLEQLEAEVEEKVSSVLKGPSSAAVGQADVDDLLASLGM